MTIEELIQRVKEYRREILQDQGYVSTSTEMAMLDGMIEAYENVLSWLKVKDYDLEC